MSVTQALEAGGGAGDKQGLELAGQLLWLNCELQVP